MTMMFQNLNKIGRSVLNFEDNSYFGNVASEKLCKTCFWWDFEIVKVGEVYSKVLDYNCLPVVGLYDWKKYLIKLKCGFIQTRAPMGTRAVKGRRKKVKVKSVFPALKLQDSSSLRIKFLGGRQIKLIHTIHGHRRR